MEDPVRAAREQLIRAGLRADDPDGDVVPEVIVRSWRRSIGSEVVSEGVNERYRDIDVDSILFRAAEPVLDRWGHQLADTGTTLFLSDRAGSIVARRASDSVRRELDRVHAAEGFDYSEEAVGTNGLGTALAENAPVFIQGSQHYKDVLAGLTCAAVPVATPAGSVIGCVSVGGATEIANPLMLSLTREIGLQIEERLRTSSSPQDLALAMSFMRYSNSRRPTVVMDQESMLANTPGLPYVSVTAHVLLWGQLSEHDWSRSESVRLVLEGTTLEVTARRVLDGPRVHYVLHFADLASEWGDNAPDVGTARADGSAATLSTTCRAQESVQVVEGPRGSGRATLARAAHSARGSRDKLQQIVVRGALTPWDEVRSLLSAGNDVLLRRLEDVSADEVQLLTELLHWRRDQAQIDDPPRGTLLVTLSSDDALPAVAHVMEGVHRAGQTEALSSRRERIPGLVKRILETEDPQGRHSVSPAALQSLMQATWPGGLTELVDTVGALVRHVPGSVIERKHLPHHLQHGPSHRSLTLLEEAERAAIVRALEVAEGNKSEAAALLGIGRTTLYRRLRQLGLDRDEGSL